MKTKQRVVVGRVAELGSGGRMWGALLSRYVILEPWREQTQEEWERGSLRVNLPFVTRAEHDRLPGLMPVGRELNVAVVLGGKSADALAPAVLGGMGPAAVPTVNRNLPDVFASPVALSMDGGVVCEVEAGGYVLECILEEVTERTSKKSLQKYAARLRGIADGWERIRGKVQERARESRLRVGGPTGLVMDRRRSTLEFAIHGDSERVVSAILDADGQLLDVELN